MLVTVMEKMKLNLFMFVKTRRGNDRNEIWIKWQKNVYSHASSTVTGSVVRTTDETAQQNVIIIITDLIMIMVK